MPFRYSLEQGQRFVLAIQFPYDQKVTLPLYRTGALEKIAGEATVVRKRVTRVTARLESLPEPSSVGPEYRAFVLWAVDSKARLRNLGALWKGEAKIETPLQTFGLVVSLEADPQAREPKGLFVLESHFPEKKSSFFGMEKVFYTSVPRNSPR